MNFKLILKSDHECYESMNRNETEFFIRLSEICLKLPLMNRIMIYIG